MRLGLRETTIRAWLGCRRIAKVKLGRRTLVPAREVERLISQNLTPALLKRTNDSGKTSLRRSDARWKTATPRAVDARD